MAQNSYYDNRPSFDHFGDTVASHGNRSSTLSVSEREYQAPGRGQNVVSSASSYSDHDPYAYNHHAPYTDEHSTHDSYQLPEISETGTPLVSNAAGMGRSSSGNYKDLGALVTSVADGLLYNMTPTENQNSYHDRAKPLVEKDETPMQNLFAKARYPIEQRIEDKKRGIGRHKYPFVGMLMCPFFARPGV
jgi:hypothetical protein